MQAEVIYTNKEDIGIVKKEEESFSFFFANTRRILVSCRGHALNLFFHCCLGFCGNAANAWVKVEPLMRGIASIVDIGYVHSPHAKKENTRISFYVKLL